MIDCDIVIEATWFIGIDLDKFAKDDGLQKEGYAKFKENLKIFVNNLISEKIVTKSQLLER